MLTFPSLIIEFEDFKVKLEDIVEVANVIINSHVENELDLTRFKKESDNWVTECQKSLSESFSENNNWFIRQFIAGSQGFSMPGNFKRPWQDEIKLERLKMTNRKNNLIVNLKLVEVCDIIRSKSFDKKIRAAYSMKQKSDFILEKLYELNNDLYYSLSILLEGNGLILKNTSEIFELGKRLEENGFINSIGGMGSDISGKITVEGSMYVEEKLEKYSENYNDITSDSVEISRAIEHIREELNKLGLGQEIIFNEIDELKDLYTKLNKKNFGQIVKGKLMDLALAKLVENDTIGFIYHELTGHALKLVN
jgi:hypothetical protein